MPSRSLAYAASSLSVLWSLVPAFSYHELAALIFILSSEPRISSSFSLLRVRAFDLIAAPGYLNKWLRSVAGKLQTAAWRRMVQFVLSAHSSSYLGVLPLICCIVILAGLRPLYSTRARSHVWGGHLVHGGNGLFCIVVCCSLVNVVISTLSPQSHKTRTSQKG